MDATSTIVAWVVSIMMAWSPVGRQHKIVEAQETVDEATTRYEEIATSLVKVTYDPKIQPLFKGVYGRARTSVLLLSMSYFESGWRRDVDLGLGDFARGDGGKSHCMMQINTGKNRTSTSVLARIINKEWSADDLIADRSKCFLAGLEMARKSFTVCKSLPRSEQLALYASGSCKHGLYESRVRFTQMVRGYDAHKPTVADSEVMDPRGAILVAGAQSP